jgi:phosphoribosyl 1,2-cyclic phosphate phosphodiesterase
LPVLGFRIGNFAYLTDFKTISEPEMAKLKNLEVLVVNALRQENHISHMTLNDSLKLIGMVKPRKAFLTHISHQMGMYNDILKLLPESVDMAYDGLELLL